MGRTVRAGAIAAIILLLAATTSQQIWKVCDLSRQVRHLQEQFDPPETWRTSCKSAHKAVVAIIGRTPGEGKDRQTLRGCFLSSDGIVATSLPVFEGWSVTSCTIYGLNLENREFSAKYELLKKSREYGLAILRPTGALKFQVRTLPVSKESLYAPEELWSREVGVLFVSAYEPITESLKRQGLKETTLYPFVYRNYISSVFSKRLACLQGRLPIAPLGAPVIDRSGNLIGIVPDIITSGKTVEDFVTLVTLLPVGWEKDLLR